MLTPTPLGPAAWPVPPRAPRPPGPPLITPPPRARARGEISGPTPPALLPAADRLSCLHRAESWARLQRDVPLRVVDEDYVRSAVEWVVDAAAPDPYASAVDR